MRGLISVRRLTLENMGVEAMGKGLLGFMGCCGDSWWRIWCLVILRRGLVEGGAKESDWTCTGVDGDMVVCR